MLTRIAMLLAPAAVDGGGSSVTSSDRPPLPDWTNEQWGVEDEPAAKPDAEVQAAKAKEKGTKDERTNTEGERPPADKPATDRAVGDDAPAADKGKPDKSASKDTKAKEKPADTKETVTDEKEQSIDEVRAELKAESWPRQAKDWEAKKSKYDSKLDKLAQGLMTRDATIKELQGKVTEYESKAAEEPQADPEVSKRMQRLEAENKELTDRITVLNVQEHPRFKAYFDKKYSSAIGEAKSIVGEERAPEIEKILKISDPEYRRERLDAFMATIEDENARFDLRGVVRDIRGIDKEKQDEIDRANETKTSLQAKQKAAVDGMQKTYENAFVKVKKVLQDPKNGMPIYQLREGEGSEAWNRGVEQRIKAAEALLLGKNLSNAESVVKTAFDAASLPGLLQAYNSDKEAWEAEKAQLEATIKELTGSQTKLKGHGATEDTAGGERGSGIKPGMNPWEVSDKWAEEAARMANET